MKFQGFATFVELIIENGQTARMPILIIKECNAEQKKDKEKSIAFLSVG